MPVNGAGIPATAATSTTPAITVAARGATTAAAAWWTTGATTTTPEPTAGTPTRASALSVTLITRKTSVVHSSTAHAGG